MNEVIDRVPAYPGRIKLTPVEGQENVYDMVRMDQPTQPGTPINKVLFDSIRNNLQSAVYTESERKQMGEAWQSGTLPSSGQWIPPIYGKGIYVTAKYNSAEAAYSIDGIHWTGATLPFSGQWSGGAYGNGKFIIVAYKTSSMSKNVVISPNGSSWSSYNTGLINSSTTWCGPVFAKGRFVVVPTTSALGSYYSYDGKTWTEMNGLVQGYWFDLVYGNNRLVTVYRSSDKIAYSTDMESWTVRSTGVSGDWNKILYGNGKWVLFSGTEFGCAYANSPDSTFTRASLPQSYQHFAFGAGVFVAVTSNGSAGAVSSDAASWTTFSLPASMSWAGLVYGGDGFVLLSSDGTTAMISKDGKNWTQVSTSLTGGSSKLSFVHDRVIATPYSSDKVLCSLVDKTAFSSYAGSLIPLFMNQIQDLPPVTQCATGSYSGTGTSGLEYQNMLVFDFVPRFGLVMSRTAGDSISFAVFSPNSAISFFTNGSSSPMSSTLPANLSRLRTSWYENTITWWSTLSTTADAILAQCNVLSKPYDYIFFG